MGRRQARRREGHHRHDRPLRRQGRLGRRRTATRASSTAWASTLADETKNGDEAATGSYSGGEYEIVGNEATRAPRTAAARPWRPCSRRTPTSTWSTRSTSRPRTARTRRSRPPAATDGLIVVGRRRLRRHRRGQGGHHRRHEPAVPGEDGRARRAGDLRPRQRRARCRRTPRASTSTTPASRS